ncbi:MAG: hypothetical protein A3C06_00605 [Candidatus Taylorbacteria bacterium RIFCSPHIGHO2_02_FULL_46_13]|uniref:Type II toxin-antitoxin system HicA family toxin n=1 Tax=Candidatus Taylorbacteria bacterium RIFCSPHIGHO2_02_FULL_46_13 TaxID=1802312 RepID=A0A1G2MTZ0_9BACT|nr:MAG: hypothetical protein A3C06_00605 [Candidatus Taylorbacteria bacterium RIFCSPHIGHO2_02_FULL_46_13]
MGGKLRVLSGKELVDFFASYGFTVHRQNASHIKLRRMLNGIKEILIIPNHKPIAKGTLKAIFHQAARYIPESELRKRFYR